MARRWCVMKRSRGMGAVLASRTWSRFIRYASVGVAERWREPDGELDADLMDVEAAQCVGASGRRLAKRTFTATRSGSGVHVRAILAYAEPSLPIVLCIVCRDGSLPSAFGGDSRMR